MANVASVVMTQVRHARIIQQLILASGNETSKAYELLEKQRTGVQACKYPRHYLRKWQRRGKASVSKRDVDDLQSRGIRKALLLSPPCTLRADSVHLRNDVRKAGNKLLQRRRANLLHRLSSELAAHGLQPEAETGRQMRAGRRRNFPACLCRGSFREPALAGRDSKAG